MQVQSKRRHDNATTAFHEQLGLGEKETKTDMLKSDVNATVLLE